ncbi:MAG: rhomboid family intramembrane serine protease [Steroidobacteraceae bacterium]
MSPTDARRLADAAGPGDPDDSRTDRVAVYCGTRAACREYGLVLEAKGLTYDLAELDGNWALLVAPAALDSAREELARYAAERTAARNEPRAVIPFGGAGAGAGVYALVLLLTAYCAGIQLFGIDWLESGALDARAGRGAEWWRAITALTLHLDQAHLLSNLLFGVGIGTLAGRVFGPGIAWASIVAAGAMANYLDMLISPSAHRAVGASTAVFAALGLLAGFAWRQRLTLRERFRYRWAPLFAGVCLLALLGAGGEHVDVLGHTLGFMAGLALGWVYARADWPRSRGSGLQAGAAAAALSLIAAAWIIALRHPAAFS